MEETVQRERYEAPSVTDFGSVEELTQGELHISLNDFPIGGATSSLPIIGPIPPSLPVN